MEGIKHMSCDRDDNPHLGGKTPNVIDLDKNRIVLKRRRLKSWTRPLSNIFKNPFGNLSTNGSLHLLGPKSPKSTNNNCAKSEVKIDIALIKKLEDEIYKRENNIRNGNSNNNNRESYDSNNGFDDDDDDDEDILFGSDEARFVFKNDTSAFKRGNKPVLLLDTRKLDPLLLKTTTETKLLSSEVDDMKQQPVYQNIDEARQCHMSMVEDAVAGTTNTNIHPTKSIIIVDNSNFYPILMRYDINNEVIENLNGNVEKCYKQFEMTKALKTETSSSSLVEQRQHKNNELYLDVDDQASNVSLDFPTECVAPKNSVLYHASTNNDEKCKTRHTTQDDSAPIPRMQRGVLNSQISCYKELFELFNNLPLLRILTEDNCDSFLSNLQTKISPQLCMQLNEIFGNKNYRVRLKFMIYKKLYKNFQTLKPTIHKRHNARRRKNHKKLCRSTSLPNIDENVLHKFCDNWKNYCLTQRPRQLLNWSTPDLINDGIYISGCAKTHTQCMMMMTPTTNNNSNALIRHRNSLSTEGNSTLSTNIDSSGSSSSTTRTTNSNRSSSSYNRQNSSNKSNNETSNVFIRKLHPIRQRASFRLKRHSVGSTDVVKTWVYRRRYFYEI